METLCQWQRNLRQAGQRRLLLLDTKTETATAYVHSLCLSVAGSRRLWVGPDGAPDDPDLPVIRATEAVRWLGRELDLVIWDGRQGNPPDSLAALMGTLGAGGLFVWLMPPLSGWPCFDDPDYARTGLATAPEHPFLARMASELAVHPAVVRLTGDGHVSGTFDVEPASVDFEPGATSDQQAAVDAVLQTGKGRRRRPLVIRADRGRGKSTALGQAAAALLQEKWHQIVVTAPQAEAVEALLTAAKQLWPGAVRNGHTLSNGNRCLRFVPVDVLLREQPEAGLVLVDEAAGLPAPLLESILTGWPRVVFSTTVHGYEGTGRGFDVRFRAALDRHAPHWRVQKLSQPIRWAPGDPFESLVNSLFLLDAESVRDAVPGDAVQIQRWQPSTADPVTLAQAFGLLTDAHYRTTPGDLRQWLDDPAATSWLARSGGPEGPVIGVLWLSDEGGLEPALADQVMRGERRLRGHLLAQSLANHGGQAAAATLRLARVIRVAVVPERRRQQVGQRLLDAAYADAVARGLDLFGTSFGATLELLTFWRRSGLATLRLGLHQSASSGEHTLQMARPCSGAGATVVQQLAGRFAEHWPGLLSHDFRALPVPLLLSLTGDWPTTEPLSAMDRSELVAFARGYRLLELSRLPLERLLRQPGVPPLVATSEDAALICRIVLQGWNWTELQSAALCTGRRDGERRMRALAGELLERVDNPAH